MEKKPHLYHTPPLTNYFLAHLHDFFERLFVSGWSQLKDGPFRLMPDISCEINYLNNLNLIIWTNFRVLIEGENGL